MMYYSGFDALDAKEYDEIMESLAIAETEDDEMLLKAALTDTEERMAEEATNRYCEKLLYRLG